MQKQTGLSYLGFNKEEARYNTWLDLTREERLFCGHLYHDVKANGREKEFVELLAARGEWVDKALARSLGESEGWEIDYEVCFYRDYLYSLGKQVNLTPYPNKRTFDLCLFSEEFIVIVEAKVHERFAPEQVKSILDDKKNVEGLLSQETGKAPKVIAVALASSFYLQNVGPYGKVIGPKMAEAFDATISWRSIYDWLEDPLYQKADQSYPHKGKAQ